MDKLFTLLELQRQALEASTRPALLHFIVNETHRLIPYEQAVFWNAEGFSFSLEKISGNASIDPQSGYATALQSALRSETSAINALPVIALNQEKHKTDGALLLFRTAEEGLIGGLWLEHNAPYTEAENRILEELTATYTQALALWYLRGHKKFFPLLRHKSLLKKALAVAFFLLALFPVRLGITAPAEIIAKDAEIVTAPFDGLIEDVKIEPGDAVAKDDILIVMEQQSLQAQMDMAEQDMSVVQSSLSRLQRESLSAPDKKSNLIGLQEDIETKKIAYDYARDLKQRSDIRARRAGIAVFSESNSLRGKPVHTGDKLMMIADPAQYELLIRVPADAMVSIAQDAETEFFLNVSPLFSHSATIRSIGYQSSLDADGLLTYKIIAVLPMEKNMRIGWKGTAKIHGGWTVLSYVILRRPLIALRTMLGV